MNKLLVVIIPPKTAETRDLHRILEVVCHWHLEIVKLGLDLARYFGQWPIDVDQDWDIIQARSRCVEVCSGPQRSRGRGRHRRRLSLALLGDGGRGRGLAGRLLGRVAAGGAGSMAGLATVAAGGAGSMGGSTAGGAGSMEGSAAGGVGSMRGLAAGGAGSMGGSDSRFHWQKRFVRYATTHPHQVLSLVESVESEYSPSLGVMGNRFRIWLALLFRVGLVRVGIVRA